MDTEPQQPQDVWNLTDVEEVENKIQEYQQKLESLDHHVKSVGTQDKRHYDEDDEDRSKAAGDGHSKASSAIAGIKFSDREIERRTEDVQLALESLPSMMEHTTYLSSELNKIGEEAGRAISRIKVLDAIQRNAKTTLARIDDILELQKCTSEVKHAIQEGDIATAAENIRTFRKIETRLPIDEQEKQEMRDYEKQIISAIMSNMEEASHFMKAEEVTNCCRRLAQLGCANFGWQKLANFLRVQLFGEFKDLMENYITSDSPQQNHILSERFEVATLLKLVERVNISDVQSFLDLISSLFGSAVDTLEGGMDIVRSAQNEELQNPTAAGSTRIQSTDTAQAAKFILQSLHELTSEVGAKLLDRLQYTERMQALLRLSKLDTNGPLQGDGLDMLKQENVDVGMDELALTLQRSMSYFRAFLGEAEDWDSAVLAEGNASLKVKSSVEDNRELFQTVGVLASLYTHFEQAAVQRGITKAIIYDEMVELEPTTSSIAEDSVFVLQKTAKRAIATGNVDAVCAAFNFVVDSLTETSTTSLDDQSRKCLDQVFPRESLSQWKAIHTLRSILEHYAQCDLNDGAGRNRYRSARSHAGQQGSAAQDVDSSETYTSPAVRKVLREFEEFRRYQEQQQKQQKSSKGSINQDKPGFQQFGEKLIGDFWESGAPGSPSKPRSKASSTGMSPATKSFAARSPVTKGSSTEASFEDSSETVFGGLSPGIIAAACAVNSFSTSRQMTETLVSTLFNELEEAFPDELEEVYSGQRENMKNSENKDAVKLSIAMEQLESALNELSNALTEVVGRLCSLLSPRLRGAMTVMEGKHSLLQYDFTEESTRLTYDVFSNEFLTALDRILDGFLRTLDEESSHLFMLRIASYVSKQVSVYALHIR
eukprot:gb/GECG01003360.1/.p1 GENE.gb/GECG01003360.1/~~gb/GECG01003360.1/.p1  ORF type:complete len:883 (+),score=147.36 gb/GECG01003360.1/:1-2649(+)